MPYEHILFWNDVALESEMYAINIITLMWSNLHCPATTDFDSVFVKNFKDFDK